MVGVIKLEKYIRVLVHELILYCCVAVQSSSECLTIYIGLYEQDMLLNDKLFSYDRPAFYIIVHLPCRSFLSI